MPAAACPQHRLGAGMTFSWRRTYETDIQGIFVWLTVTGAGTISLGRWLVGKRRGATQPRGSETTMHVRTLLAAFNIAPDEGVPVALLLSHSFFMGLAGVFFYTAASAIFLMTFAPTALPFVYMASAGFVALCGFLYAQLEARLPVSRLFLATLVVLVLSVVACRAGLWLTHHPIFGELLRVWDALLRTPIGSRATTLASRFVKL